MTVDRYTSPSRFEEERQELFRRLPIIVGRASDVAEPGSFFTHDAAGVPILVTRDHGNVVHAMLNVCRHRGTRLVSETEGTAKAFVCPYHAWTYDLCGRLGNVPLSRCLPTLEREESALVELPCESRHGFLWVVPSPRAKIDVKAMLGSFDEDFEAFGLAEHVVFDRSSSVRSANWKLVIDALREGVSTDTDGSNVRSVVPNSILVFHPETVSHIALFPRSLGEVELVHTMLAPRAPKSEEERASWQRTWELLDVDQTLASFSRAGQAAAR